MNIKTISFGCRLNSLESEKIAAMLSPVLECAIVVNTCAVTGAAEKQSASAVRRIARENPNAPIFITGCAATRNPGIFSEISNTIVIPNSDKMNLSAFANGLSASPCHNTVPEIHKFHTTNSKMSKQFIQIQNGCNHNCTYCITRQLRGPQVSFSYDDILRDASAAIDNGFNEIVLTGVDIASFTGVDNDGKTMLIYDLCARLLNDVPGILHLRLSSMDPASAQIPKIIEMIEQNPRMMPHIHLSMQSGCDKILRDMGRRHTTDMVRKFITNAPKNITFSMDIICGFPGETDELFNETCATLSELKPIKIHAFPYSARPNTIAATMGGQIPNTISKSRVAIITDMANAHLREFMKTQIDTINSVLMEENNIGRTPNDIEIKIPGEKIIPHKIYTIKIIDISDLHFIGQVCYGI